MSRAVCALVLCAGASFPGIGCDRPHPADQAKAGDKKMNGPADEAARLEKALASATEIIRRDPSDAVAYTIRAATYRQMGDYDRAIADYTEAIRLARAFAQDHPTDALARGGVAARAYLHRGACHDAKGEPDKALADYKEADRLDPKLLEAEQRKRIGK
jgi:tetratricopeptide (TPR) repeat protein